MSSMLIIFGQVYVRKLSVMTVLMLLQLVASLLAISCATNQRNAFSCSLYSVGHNRGAFQSFTIADRKHAISTRGGWKLSSK